MNDAQAKYRNLRMKMRRNLRTKRRQLEDAAQQTDDSINRLVFRRFENLYRVRRFVAAWIVLTFFIGFGSIWQVRGLDKYYLEAQPTDGGVYREGVLGSFTNASPLFAVTNVDVAVSKLVFSGLFKIAPSGDLEPDVATNYSVDEKGLTYTVGIRTDVLWHDGQKLSADDVVFTYDTIKNSDVNSPLNSSWQDVRVEKVDDYTVKFILPNVLSSFKYSLTNGIVPQHILKSVDAGDLRTSLFNTVSPVGSGPFKYEKVEVIGVDPDKRQEKLTLTANERFYRGDVTLDGIVIRTYREEEALIRDFDDRLITSMVGLNSLPDNLPEDATIQSFSTPLRSAVMLFFNNSNPLLAEKKVREALVRATNSDDVRNSLPYQLVEADSPFLKSHFAYNEEKAQYGSDVEAAKKLLDEAGWILRDDGYRYKNDQKLTLRIVSQSIAEYAAVVQKLQEQWQQVGVALEATLQPEESVQSTVIATHNYEVLLYGIAIGPDPDVFAFWHSSQSDPSLRTRLNLSEYKSEQADAALEAGRTRSDENLRRVKYEPFLDAWRSDVPAIALYQPRFLFISRGVLENYPNGQFNGPSDRFYSVDRWQVRRQKTIRQ